ncbi:MAG: TetR/AcrR family transcriptional regulator [Anaerovoracaceae bacterium]|jgi:AcrR family transcriptional regulator
MTRANDTKTKIMETAIEAFNEEGATNVSTVQLANKMEISPGNLYYYFYNKEHLIREIWATYIKKELIDIVFHKDLALSENDIISFFSEFLHFVIKYRFFYRELHILLDNDPTLGDLFREHHLEINEKFHEIMGKWTEIGIMRPLNDKQERVATENLFAFLRTSYCNYVMLYNDDDPASFERTTMNHACAMVFPYMTEPSIRRMLILLRTRGIIKDEDLDFYPRYSNQPNATQDMHRNGQNFDIHDPSGHNTTR